MIKVAIEVTSKSFLPEAYAYQKFLASNGYECEFVYKGDNYAKKFDAVILFHGFHPFWKKYPKVVIGEYHSLSTGKLHFLKDKIKVILNKKADIYIFLNNTVMHTLGFDVSPNCCLRSMGFDQNLIVKNSKKDFDLVYVGSFRHGLDKILKELSDNGFNIAVAGFTLGDENYKNVKFFGRVDRAETFKIMSRSYCGLNFIPDVWPWNVQDSTKVVEYCAADLPVVTNRYKWINAFETKRSARFMSLSDLKSKQDLYAFDFKNPDVSDLEWNKLLTKSGLLEKLNHVFRDI